MRSRSLLYAAVAMLLVPGRLSALTIEDERVSSGVLTVYDNEKPVLSYRYGDQLKAGVDAKYTRSSYIHPIYSLDGEPITDDFPEDHFHHRGLSWTWPHVETHSTTTQTWHPATPTLRQHFHRWVDKRSDDGGATVTLENKWVLGGTTEVALEKVEIGVGAERESARAIDVTVTIQAVGTLLILKGTDEGKKGYGGFAIRMGPQFKGAPLSSDTGPLEKDAVLEPHKWIDISDDKAGITMLASPQHPGFPPKWMARNSYTGFINVSWPGLEAHKIDVGKSVTLKYRLLVHKGNPTNEQLTKLYELHKDF